MVLLNQVVAHGVNHAIWLVNPALSGPAQTFTKSLGSPSQIIILFPESKIVLTMLAVLIMSKLNLLKDYWQMPLTPRAKEISA